MKEKDSDIVSSKSSGINVTYAISEEGDMQVQHILLIFLIHFYRQILQCQNNSSRSGIKILNLSSQLLSIHSSEINYQIHIKTIKILGK